MYCVPHELELLSEGELARYDGWYVMIENEAQGPLTADDLAARWSPFHRSDRFPTPPRPGLRPPTSLFVLLMLYAHAWQQALWP